jgi:hypothetical protein
MQGLEELDDSKRENPRTIQPLVPTAKPRRDVTALEAISSASVTRNSLDWAVLANRRASFVKSRDVTALELISSACVARNSRDWAVANHREPAFKPRDVTVVEPRDVVALEAIYRMDPVNPSVATSPAAIPRDITATHAISFAWAAKLARKWAKRKLNRKSKLISTTSAWPTIASSPSAPKSVVPPPSGTTQSSDEVRGDETNLLQQPLIYLLPRSLRVALDKVSRIKTILLEQDPNETR